MQSFTELSLSAPISRAIAALGFEKPSPVQAETLPILLGEPTDFLGLAATGTGKTAAFAIPLLEKIDPKLGRVQALILCPTRELALQVAEQVSLLGKFKGVRTVAVYGGSSYADQIHGFKSGASVVVGTPGRVVDHLERGTLKLGDLQTVVLDEADEMISMGFKEELEKILGAVSGENCNKWMFSATMSREVRRVADEYLVNPKQVQINRTEMVPASIEQYYYPTMENNKPEILCKLMEAADDFYGLIFCQTKALVVDLAQFLHERGYKVDSLHGDKDQNSRERTMQSFRDRKVNVLVCTDVASRGLDVKDITHVVNYSLPRELDNYVHRIGRTGRSGKTGIAMNLVTASHRRLIWQIENMTKTRMIEGQIPTRREIGARRVAKQLDRFSNQPYFARALEVMNDDWKAAVAQMTPEEVAGRFLSMMMPEVFSERDANRERSSEKRASAAAPRAAAVTSRPVIAEKRFDAAAPFVVAAAKPAPAPVAAVAAPVAVAQQAAPQMAAPQTIASQPVAVEELAQPETLAADLPPRRVDRYADKKAESKSAPRPFRADAESRPSVAPVARARSPFGPRARTGARTDSRDSFSSTRAPRLERSPRAPSRPANAAAGFTKPKLAAAPRPAASFKPRTAEPTASDMVPSTLNRKARRALKFGVELQQAE